MKTLRIRTPKHLAFRLDTSVEELQKVANKVEALYLPPIKQKKKSGDFRELSRPKLRLKRIQKTIHRLLTKITPHKCAHCGIKERSNLTNSRIHAGKKWVFSLDFKNFFPSISHHLVYHMFRHELDCSPEVSRFLTRICTINGEVPQGGSMSNDIANLVCRSLDNRLYGLSVQYGIDYTRYCDDLSFSGDCIPKSFIKKIKKIVSQCGFRLNVNKEFLLGKHQAQIVTGISVNQKRPCVPRRVRRQWRKEQYLFEKYESKRLPEDHKEKKALQIQGRKNYLDYVNKKPKES